MEQSTQIKYWTAFEKLRTIENEQTNERERIVFYLGFSSPNIESSWADTFVKSLEKHPRVASMFKDKTLCLIFELNANQIIHHSHSLSESLTSSNAIDCSNFKVIRLLRPLQREHQRIYIFIYTYIYKINWIEVK